MVYAANSIGNDGGCDTYAVDATTGTLAWHTKGSAGPLPYAAGPGAVYGFQAASSSATNVIAISAASGKTLWTHDAGPLLSDAANGWLTYADGLVYIATGTSGNPSLRSRRSAPWMR
jgi:outer membrane protein assembly factor BamB